MASSSRSHYRSARYLAFIRAFQLDEHGARLLIDRDHAAEEISRIRGAGQGEMTTEEILALTRR